VNQKNAQAQRDARLRWALYNYMAQQADLRAPASLSDHEIKRELSRVLGRGVDTIATWCAAGAMALLFLSVAILALSVVGRLALLILSLGF
jgi:hypothetical protein